MKQDRRLAPPVFYCAEKPSKSSVNKSILRRFSAVLRRLPYKAMIVYYRRPEALKAAVRTCYIANERSGFLDH